MVTPDVSLWLSALAVSTRKVAAQNRLASGTDPAVAEPAAHPRVTVELHVDHGTWSAVLARDDQRVELGGLTQLIRFLELLAAETARPAVRGLR